MNKVALMYHGIYGVHHSVSLIADEDLPYALSAERFEEHLKTLAAENVLFTFDDGDAGWVKEALPLLEKYQVKALFFVTPELIGKAGYCTWKQLTELVNAGHKIGAHGLTHRFLPDLSDEDCFNELKVSREQLEDALAIPVDVMSFPGGRFGDREIQFAKQAGYVNCYTSVPGFVTSSDYLHSRIAVRGDSDLRTLLKIVQGDKKLWRNIRVSYQLKKSMKKLLGNRGYHTLYRLVKGGTR